MGYSRVGFADIVGVDNQPQKNYPFAFIQADALEYLEEHGHEFDVIHTSPPCQGYSIMRNLPWLRDKEYPLLIDPVRELLEATGKPWIIENVMGAHLPAGWLCGTMFGLPFYRHRAFETNWFWMQPGHGRHVARNAGQGGKSWDSWKKRRKEDGDFLNGNGALALGNGAQTSGVGIGHAKGWKKAAEAMDIDWMKRDELTQAIPPTYCEFIGKALLNHA